MTLTAIDLAHLPRNSVSISGAITSVDITGDQRPR
jgi:hypothetical protein